MALRLPLVHHDHLRKYFISEFEKKINLLKFFLICQLHHTDKRLPHYRKGEWSFQRGAACTVDRPFLGWQGRFFLHDVAHYHVVHHFFPQMPFYNGEEATRYLQAFIGEHYHRSSKPVFQELWTVSIDLLVSSQRTVLILLRFITSANLL